MSKKGKKSKGKTLSLNEFLATGPTPGVAPVVTRKPGGSGNWADDVDDDDTDLSRRVVLPTAPRATWGNDVDDSLVPRDPPYTAFLSNLPYDTEEEELYIIFRELRVSGVRLPSGDRGKRGCGYVEFEDRTSLISALSMSDPQLKGRTIRIAVADNVSDDRRRGMRDRERGLEPDRSSMGDWRSGPRDEPPPAAWDGQRRGFGDRFGDRDRGGFGPRDRFGDRGGLGGTGGRFEDRERRSFGPGFDERDAPRRDDFPSGEPSQRPRLNLQPRTKPLEEVAAPTVKPPEPAPATGAKAASVFGGAKPVDTAAREREIEERLARERGMLGVGAGASASGGAGAGAARDSRGRERDWDRDRDRYSSTSSDRRREETWRNPSSGTGGDSSDGGRTSPYRSERGRGTEQGRGGSGQSSLDRQSQSRSWSHERDDRPRTGASAPRSDGAYVPPRGRTEMRSPSREQERVPAHSRDRDSSQEESTQIPKYSEEEAPNFVASNKYAYLPSEEDPQAAGSD